MQHVPVVCCAVLFSQRYMIGYNLLWCNVKLYSECGSFNKKTRTL